MRVGGLRLFAAALVAIAALLVVRQLGVFGYRPLGSPAERPPGPPIPDARGRLAYVRDGDLYTLDLRDGLERRLTRSGGVRAPRSSGGGTWLAFEREGKVSVIRVDGTGLIEVPGADIPSSATWSPQGARLAYSSSDGSLSTFDPAARGNPRRIVVPAGSGVGAGVAWAADASRVAYERHQRAGANASNEGIWTITELGRDPLPVFLASGDFALTVCCWTYNGTFVLFWQGSGTARGAADGAPLMLGTPLGAQPVQVVEAAPVARAWIDSAPRSDGFAFVAGGREGARRLVIGQPRTIAGNRLAVDTAVVESALSPSSPAWAPLSGAAQLLAYSAGGRIWLARAQGAERHALLAEATVPPSVSDERPMWALDGKTLLFARRLNPEAAARQGGTPDSLELWVASADGATSKRVVSGLADPGPGAIGVVDWAAVFDYHHG